MLLSLFPLSSTMTQITPPQQGIVAILAPRPDPSSIRRTFSADMSSTQWLQHNGMKKILSSHQLGKLPPPVDSSSPDQSDLWSSIIHSQKRQGNDNSAIPPPPYVQKPVSPITFKSLQVCTEALGSETGSDCFSSDPPPEQRKSINEPNYRKLTTTVAAAPPPPPLRSIIGDGYGDSLRIESRRENGRLVMEAVPVPPKNYFRAHRSDGRLILSVIRRNNPKLEVEDEIGGGGEGITQKQEFPIEQRLNSMIIRAPIMKKLLRKDEFEISISLPPRVARMIPSPSFNAYECLWRNRTAVGFINKQPNFEVDGGSGKGFRNGYLIRGCKEGRIRPLLMRGETYCVATS